MKLDNEIKLDFNDVLIRPKRSELSSRSEVNLETTYKFKYSTTTWSGTPIICSNMDTIGTVNMYKSINNDRLITCFHKYINIDDIKDKFIISDLNFVKCDDVSVKFTLNSINNENYL